MYLTAFPYAISIQKTRDNNSKGVELDSALLRQAAENATARTLDSAVTASHVSLDQLENESGKVQEDAMGRSPRREEPPPRTIVGAAKTAVRFQADDVSYTPRWTDSYFDVSYNTTLQYARLLRDYLSRVFRAVSHVLDLLASLHCSGMWHWPSLTVLKIPLSVPTSSCTRFVKRHKDS
jgi:hypothetical protein